MCSFWISDCVQFWMNLLNCKIQLIRVSLPSFALNSNWNRYWRSSSSEYLSKHLQVIHTRNQNYVICYLLISVLSHNYLLTLSGTAYKIVSIWSTKMRRTDVHNPLLFQMTSIPIKETQMSIGTQMNNLES